VGGGQKRVVGGGAGGRDLHWLAAPLHQKPAGVASSVSHEMSSPKKRVCVVFVATAG
jgi:hypothetical protein